MLGFSERLRRSKRSSYVRRDEKDVDEGSGKSLMVSPEKAEPDAGVVLRLRERRPCAFIPPPPRDLPLPLAPLVDMSTRSAQCSVRFRMRDRVVGGGFRGTLFELLLPKP